MICIYKIISPENRIYVGQTTNYFKRIKNYNNLKCKSQTILYRSFKKYGVNNHIFDIIELCELEQLNERERYWQDYYNVLKNGLNCRLTTSKDKSGKLSESTKFKIGKANTGKICSTDKKQKISLANKGNYHTEETKKKISISQTGKKHTNESKLKIGISSKTRIRNRKKIINISTNEIYNSIDELSIISGISKSWLYKILGNFVDNKTNYKYHE